MNEKQYHSEDQINFAGLKNFVYAFLQEFFKFVDFTRVVIRKKLIYIIIGAILGVLVGLFYYYNKKQLYTASMTVIFNKLTGRTYGQALEDLNTLLKAGSKQELAKKLQVPTEVVAELVNIDARNMANRELITDTSSRIYQLFRINVILTQNVSVDTLQKALVNYLRDMPYLKNMREVEMKYLQERLRSVDSDLSKLDTLKTEVNRFLANSKISSTIYNNAINPAEIYEQSHLLNNQRELVQRQLNIENFPVSLVDGFKLVKAPRSMPLPNLLLIIGSIGLFTGFLFGLLLETKRQVQQR